MKFYLAGQWCERPESIRVANPFDGQIIDSVPMASADDVERAVFAAVEGAKTMAALSGYERFQILKKASVLVAERGSELARTISSEEGKTLAESKAEVARSVQTLELSGEEARRLGGETLALDGAPGGSGKLGFTMRVPCGVVAAITPFNFPLNLVCHKLGPALAAGNSVILKPASDTPLVALKLVEILLEAGLPALGVSCITGPGSTVGNAICSDSRVRKISFTGSFDVGEQICKTAGMKRVTMELGSNSPLVVLPDADLDKVVDATLVSGFSNAGQVCISTQRLIATETVHDQLLEALRPKIDSIVAGDQLIPETNVGPMVRNSDANRVRERIDQAVADGAILECGGDIDGSIVQPALLSKVTPTMNVARDELFGPAVSLMRVADIADAVRMANETRFGLSAGVFTQDIDAAIRFAKQVDSGNIHINSSPMWRSDVMPYGGLKDSGLGKEGPKYAIREMTEMKTVVIHSN